MLKALTIFSGNANRELAQAICRYVETPLGKAEVTRFADGEVYVEINENVRGVNCFVVQPTCAPANDNLMELLVMIDALRRASAGSIIACIPYFGYARQDRKSKPRTPISARLVADLITAAGVDRVVSIDLHAGQIQGFFNIPVDHLYAMPVLMDDLQAALQQRGGDRVARRGRRRTRARLLEAPRHQPGHHRQAEARAQRQRGRQHHRRREGARRDHRRRHGRHRRDAVRRRAGGHGAGRAVGPGAAPATAVLSPPAIERIMASPLSELLITDTIALRPDVRACPKIKVLSVARLLGEAVKRIHHGDSISSLFI